MTSEPNDFNKAYYTIIFWLPTIGGVKNEYKIQSYKDSKRKRNYA